MKKIISVLLVLITLSSIICSSLADVSAEGSVSMNKNGGNRPFTEWYGLTTAGQGANDLSNTAGVPRQQKIYVYAFAGETIYFGSSVNNSRLDINGKTGSSSATGYDITVTGPSGNVYAYDVDGNAPTGFSSKERHYSEGAGAGYIKTTTQESNGPKYEYTDASGNKTVCNQNGYTPYALTAPSNGVYEFHFHSVTSNGDNPSNTGNFITDQKYSTVGAWDITVVKQGQNLGSQQITGRTYSNWLSFNMGANSRSLNTAVYVVTSDGFIYKTDFNGLDPYGFVFFGNNRGVINEGRDSTSSYHSVGTDQNNMSTLTSKYHAAFHNPSSEDSNLDKTYKIFFQYPNDDLVNVLFPKAYEPAKVTNLKFYGFEEGKSYTGTGGYFKFDISNASTVKMTMDFSSINGGVITQTLAVNPNSTNYFDWDGRDGNGNIVSAGVYNSDQIKVEVSTMSGEYHFPMLDVESNSNGIKITRVNKIYRKVKNSLGQWIDKDVNAEDDDISKTTIYYNNLPLYNGTHFDESVPAPSISSTDKVGLISAADSHGIKSQYGYTNVHNMVTTHQKYNDLLGTYSYVTEAVSANQTNGIDSSSGACKFNASTGAYFAGGNQAIIDVWTLYKKENQVTAASLEVVDTEKKVVNLDGFVFYDSDNNGLFSVTNSDSSISHVTVDLLDENDNVLNTTTTDMTGKYRFNSVTYDAVNGTKYKIRVTRSKADDSLTTGRDTFNGYETQSIVLSTANLENNSNYSASNNTYTFYDVGYYYERFDKAITVYKKYKYDSSFDHEIPKSVLIKLYYSYIDKEQKQQTGFTGKQVTLTNENYEYSFEKLNKYVDGYIVDYYPVEYSYVTATGETIIKGSDNDMYISTTEVSDLSTTEIKYTITNTKKGLIGLTKVDAVDTSKALPDATFELYKGTNSNPQKATLVGTYTTNSSGKLTAYVTQSGTYFFKETIPTFGYTNLTPYSEDIYIDVTKADSCSALVTVTNAKVVSVSPSIAVVDYGKPIPISIVSDNNVSLSAIGSGVDSSIVLGTGQTATAMLTGQAQSVQGKYGTFTIKDSTHILYTPTKYVNQIDKAYFAVYNKETNTYLHQTVTVVPANIVYYEDSFGNIQDDDTTNGIVYSGDWQTVGTTENTNQDDGTVGNGQNYGFDSSYNSDSAFSNGSAKVVTGTGTTTAKFKFSGTGFDIIGRTDNTTGMIQVRVYDSANKLIKTYPCVTETTQEGLTLYQTPVVKLDLQKYDTYTVEIKVLGANLFTQNTTFYLDAIRIYNPIDPNSSDYAYANNVYKSDDEYNSDIKELRNYLLESGAQLVGSNIVFVDGNEAAGLTPSSGVVDGTYQEVGPNNEVYLAKGQSIGFRVSVGNNVPKSFQIGAKAVNGSTKMIAGGSTASPVNVDINSTTDMYYNITNGVTTPNGIYQIVITNNGDNVLSLTNLKITYDSDYSITMDSVQFYSDTSLLAATEQVAVFRALGKEEPTTPTSTKPTEPATEVDNTISGDINQDGKLSIKDATIVQRISAGLVKGYTQQQRDLGDVDQNDILNINDVTGIQKEICGITYNFNF